MAFHEVEAFLEAVGFDQGIWIEQQDVFGLAQADGLVVGFGEAHIVLVGDELHLGKLFPNHFHRIVHRVVVHHENLEILP